jgi:carboxyl-terminal processing protease
MEAHSLPRGVLARLIVPILLVAALTNMPHLARAQGCEGKTVIFEDDFSDESGGWSLAPPNVSIENSSLVIESPLKQNKKSLNITYTVNEADICADVIFPNPTTDVAAGLMVWAPDYENFYSLQIQPNGRVSIWRYQNGKWLALRAPEPERSVERGKEQVNHLRVTATDKSLTFIVNQTKIRQIKGRAPGSDWHFGVYGQDGKVVFRHFKVTSIDSDAASVPAQTQKDATTKLYQALSFFGDVFERIHSHYVVAPDEWKLVDEAVDGMVKLAGLSTSAIDKKVTCRDEVTSINTYSVLICFGKMFEQLRKLTPSQISDEKFIAAAVSAMAAGLDPHSIYMDPKSFRDMQVQTRGDFGGPGLEITMEDELVRVVAPIDDAPAAKAGIRANDIITHLDGTPVQGMTLNQVVEKLRGPVNTKIKLRVMRKGVDKPLDISITRDIIRVHSVRMRIETPDVGYIRITQFNEQTTERLTKAIGDITAQIPTDKLRGFIIDLRNDSGGLLDQAISVSDTFLDRGEIVSTRGRDPDMAQRFNARPGDLIKGKPIIVLINGGSAGAAEIVAGALQDHKRATLIGARSFGMGSIQTIIPLGPGKGALRLTTARYYTPSGRSIQAKGIVPNIEVLQDVPEDVKSRSEIRGESSLSGHLKAAGEEQGGSQSYVPSDVKDDKALNLALDLMRGIRVNAAFTR